MSAPYLQFRRNQAVTPDEEKVKKSCPSNVGMCPEAGLSNATYFGVPASVQGSHFPFPVNTTVCNNANKGHPNMVKGDGLQQPGVCNRSSNNSEHASTGSDEGIESAPASANSFISKWANIRCSQVVIVFRPHIMGRKIIICVAFFLCSAHI